jgi:type 1 glutamine amidotransferase
MTACRAAPVLLAIALTLACAAPTTVPDPPAGQPLPSGGPPPIRVLVLTATAGFRHDSIATARQVLPAIAASSGEFVVTFTEDLRDLAAARLASFDVVMFALTSGELALTAEEKSALLAFVNAGGGFIGIHSATDTLYDWPDYGRLVGAYFKEHPWAQEATVLVESGGHAATTGLGASFRMHEEYYTFRENPRSFVQVLLSLDASSVGAAGDFPLAWTQTIGAGRSFYTALGHFDDTWRDGRFQSHLAGAIRWVARREER